MTQRFLSARMVCVGASLMALALAGASADAQAPEPIAVDGQPLAANVNRLLQALDFLGHPLPADVTRGLLAAAKAQDAAKLQQLLDPQALILVNLSPEARVKAKRGPADAVLQQGGYTPILIKIVNESTVTKPLRIASPQALPIYSKGPAGEIKKEDLKGRFLDVEIFDKQPMTDKLSGLQVEYVLGLVHSSEAGKREATLAFDVGQGTQDLGFRAEVPILFNVRPAIPVKLKITDFDGQPTTGRFTFHDGKPISGKKDQALGKVFPPKSKRLAPDFFFQEQVYRHDGGTVLLPPGELTMIYGRGPEYYQRQRKVVIPDRGEAVIEVKLERWVNTADYGWYSGDHHIHAAGCAHYTNPTEGVFADDMFLHVKGEALNVGCNLTWGPCYDFQRQFFTPGAHKISEPFTVLKYDVEVSGFGSQALGHVCLINLRDQTYPGSEGTKTKGWPTWTTPLMRWAKGQGAYCGYAHSASGLTFDPKGNLARAAAKQLVGELDRDKDQQVSPEEAKKGLLPDAFAAIDANNDGLLNQDEVVGYIQRSWNTKLPNYAIPPMNGIGAQEICVTSAQGLCDFISAMDTARVPEWNCWYHIMNCGFPLKASGETDFPCISGSRVGEGRVYVQLGKIGRIDFNAWAEGMGKGRSYVSDGYAHALEFSVNGKPTGGTVGLSGAGKVSVKAKVAFAAETPLGTAKGGQVPKGKTRLVEIVVNGYPVASKELPADDKQHDLTFDIPIERSSWVALRQFPQLHTNPVNVIVDEKPIRASRRSALWCIGTIEQLWRVRGPGTVESGTLMLPTWQVKAGPNAPFIADAERAEALTTFQRAIETYRKIAAECPEGS